MMAIDWGEIDWSSQIFVTNFDNQKESLME